MSWIRSLIALILASLLISFGGGCGEKANKDGTEKTEKKETKLAEPKGPGGGEMK